MPHDYVSFLSSPCFNYFSLSEYTNHRFIQYTFNTSCCLSTQDFVANDGIACAHWSPYIGRHRSLSWVLLTHVWKPSFIPAIPTLCRQLSSIIRTVILYFFVSGYSYTSQPWVLLFHGFHYYICLCSYTL